VQAVTVRPEKSLPDTVGPIEGTATALSANKRAETLAKVVFVVDSESHARIRRVKTGIASDTDIEILDGLQEGDRIVEGPYRVLAKDLKEGDPVEHVEPGKGKRSKGRG
jgi:HlyD family secretion protein